MLQLTYQCLIPPSIFFVIVVVVESLECDYSKEEHAKEGSNFDGTNSIIEIDLDYNRRYGYGGHGLQLAVAPSGCRAAGLGQIVGMGHTKWPGHDRTYIGRHHWESRLPASHMQLAVAFDRF